jgi:hypothetical protein
MARDLEKDLAICEAATPGPWEVEQTKGVVRTAITDALDPNIWPLYIVMPSPPFVLGKCGAAIAVDHFRGGIREAEAVARFIAEARTGWSYAIRRALAAEAELLRVNVTNSVLEAEVDRLRNELNILQEQLEQRRSSV